MRILQIIDSLEAGGAERMAVNYANALAARVGFSGLAVTRKEGSLKESVSDKVDYCFLDRKSKLDLGSILKLRRFCKTHEVQLLHAHSSSWFIAVCVKLSMPSLKIVWHDHYGLSEFLDKRKPGAMAFGSRFFSGIISVNEKLRAWSKSNLKCKNAIYLPNFATSDESQIADTMLKGEDGKRILCLANLRAQKDHFMLIEVAKKLRNSDWTFHLVGKDFGDAYASEVKKTIRNEKLGERIFVYGSRNDVKNIISQSEICILTSESEGLPVALLEYGFESKAVVSTAVGEIPTVIASRENGLLCEPKHSAAFASALDGLIEDRQLRETLGRNLFETVNRTYSQTAVLEKYLDWLQKL